MKIFLTFLLLFDLAVCYSQEKSIPETVRIMTKDGNTFTGQVVSSDSLKIIFRADKLGEISLLRADVRKITPVGVVKVKDGKAWYENPQSTRYLFSPNGYGLKKGEGYYQNVWVLVNSFAVGVTDHFSLGGGLVPLFLFEGAPTPVWMTAKASLPVVKDKFNLGAGVLAGTALGEPDSGFGIFYGIATVGSKDVNASLGIGYGFSAGSMSSLPVINIGGMCRIGPRGYLLTENYIISDESSTLVMLSFGGRTLIRDIALDYGLVLPMETDGGMVGVPWLGLTIPFGKKP